MVFPGCVLAADISLCIPGVSERDVMERNGPLALTIRAAVSLALLALFLYALAHSGPPAYFPSGRRHTPISVVLGAAFMLSVVSLFLRLSGRK